jgi:hypothetical protein
VRVSPNRDTELVVECLVRSATDHVVRTQPPELVLVMLARFGTTVAQTMAGRDQALSRLRIQALVRTTAEPVGSDAWLDSIVLNLHGEGDTVKREDLERTALELVEDRSRWRGPAAAVPVRIDTVEVKSTRPAVAAPPPPPEPAPEASSPPAAAPAPPPPREPAAEPLPEMMPPPEPTLAPSIEAESPAPPPEPEAPAPPEEAAPAEEAKPPGHAAPLEDAAPPEDVARREPVRRRPVLLAGAALLALALLGLVFVSNLVTSPQAPGSPPFITSVPIARATVIPPPPTLPPPTAAPAPTAAVAKDAPTAAPIIQPTPTALVAAPTATAPPVPTATAGPRTVVDTRFNTGFQPGWPDNRAGVAWFANDGYHLRARTPGQFVALGVPQALPVGDVLVSLRYHKLSGPSGGGVGIILRDQDPRGRDGQSQSGRFYVLEVSDTGEVGIWRREANEWIDLVRWTHADVVQPAEQGNLLEARAVGGTLALRVNGQEAVSATDQTLSAGGVGVFLGGDDNEAILEQLAIQTP